MMFSRVALIAASLALAANAHLYLSSPTPIEGTAPKNPLDTSGSNFPCHGVSLPSTGGQSMPAGSSQILAWDLGGGSNTAVHGGGSCQISITYETDPIKVKDQKNWFVIYSVEGGCPSNTHQNLDGSYSGPKGNYSGAYECTNPITNGVDCVNHFNFTIPKGVKDGHAIMAWTWFNSVGNREMYMNCINTELSGGDGSEMDSLPNMFVANLASVNTCPTTQSMDLAFPNPGQYVMTKKPSGLAAKTAITFPMAKPTGAGCDGDGGAAAGGSAAATTGAPSSPPSYVALSYAAPASSIPAYGAPSAPLSAKNDAPVTITSMATVTGAAPTSPAYSAPAAASASAMPPSQYGSTNSSSGSSPNNDATSLGSCASGSVSCSSPGSVVCIGITQWGLCDINNCAIAQALAVGTQCSGGVIVRRSMRHVRRHVQAGHRKSL